MTDRQHGRTSQVPLWYKVLTAPLMAVAILFLWLGFRNAEEWGQVDHEKAEQARRRSEKIEDWSEVKGNDDWR